jgi:hypothetical protein
LTFAESLHARVEAFREAWYNGLLLFRDMQRFADRLSVSRVIWAQLPSTVAGTQKPQIKLSRPLRSFSLAPLHKMKSIYLPIQKSILPVFFNRRYKRHRQGYEEHHFADPVLEILLQRAIVPHAADADFSAFLNRVFKTRQFAKGGKAFHSFSTDGIAVSVLCSRPKFSQQPSQGVTGKRKRGEQADAPMDVPEEDEPQQEEQVSHIANSRGTGTKGDASIPT